MRIDNPDYRHFNGTMVPALLKSVVVDTPVTLVSFTLPPDYVYFVFKIRDYVPTTDVTGLNLRVSKDNGLTFENGASDYLWVIFKFNTTIQANTSDSADAEISLIGIGTSIGNAAGEGLNGIVYFYNPGQPSGLRPHFGSSVSWIDSAGLTTYSEMTSRYGVVGQSVQINALRFAPSAGNIGTGSIFEMYGIR